MQDGQDDDDEQLRIAIALSLATKDNLSAEPQNEVDEDFERDLKLALEISKAVDGTSGDSVEPLTTAMSSKAAVSKQTSAIPASTHDSAATSNLSFMSERAALEHQRLQRQKRHLENTEPVTEDPPAKRARLPSAPASGPSSSGHKGGLFSTQLFLDGEVRQTTNDHVSSNSARPVFGILDILSPAIDLDFVLISAFGTDFQWLHSMIPAGVPLLSINHAADSERYETKIKPIGPDGWLHLTPRMNKGGVMHVKLFYKSGRLRLVIPTANLIPEDWRDIENTVFLQDLQKQTSSVTNPGKSHEFPKYLAAFLKLLSVPTGLTALVQGGYPALPLPSLDALSTQWDWGRVVAKLVGSPAGNHEGWEVVRRWGHPRLGEVIRDLKAQPPKGKVLQMEYQGSSIGNYTTQYLNEIYKSGCGATPQAWLDTPKAKLKAQSWPPIQIVFPTLGTVENTVLSRLGASSFFCKKQYWEKANAPKNLFRDSRARSGRVLMHTKMILGTFVDAPATGVGGSTAASSSRWTNPSNGKGKGKAKKDVQPESDTESEEETGIEQKEELLGWLYIGSHNFSMAAWGSVSGTVGKPKLWISNFELGVVLPVRDKVWLDRVVPWERPAPEYGGRDVPWMQEEHLYNEPGLQALLRMAQ